MSSLSQLSKEELLRHAKILVEEDRKISLQLIEVLRECEKRMLFAELGYGSLWQFAVEHLGLSEGSAQLRISAMRLARENPQVVQSLESGKLSLSNAAQLHSFFQAEKKHGKLHTSESKRDIIESVTGLSKRECERQLFALAPESVPQEKERIVSDTKTELKLVLDAALMEKLQRLKELLAHQLPQATYGELLGYLADSALVILEKKKGGVQNRSPRPDEVIDSDLSDTQSQRPDTPAREINPTPRIYIRVATRQSLWRRAGGRCEQVSAEGVRCQSRYQLELDHRVPLAAGGTNDERNLRYVCRTHNLYQAQQVFGSLLMKKYVSALTE